MWATCLSYAKARGGARHRGWTHANVSQFVNYRNAIPIPQVTEDILRVQTDTLKGSECESKLEAMKKRARAAEYVSEFFRLITMQTQ